MVTLQKFLIEKGKTTVLLSWSRSGHAFHFSVEREGFILIYTAGWKAKLPSSQEVPAVLVKAPQGYSTNMVLRSSLPTYKTILGCPFVKSLAPMALFPLFIAMSPATPT